MIALYQKFNVITEEMLFSLQEELTNIRKGNNEDVRSLID
jgi:hypothetical protein